MKTFTCGSAVVIHKKEQQEQEQRNKKRVQVAVILRNKKYDSKFMRTQTCRREWLNYVGVAQGVNFECASSSEESIVMASIIIVDVGTLLGLNNIEGRKVITIIILLLTQVR